jgi:hypothetical protein
VTLDRHTNTKLHRACKAIKELEQYAAMARKGSGIMGLHLNKDYKMKTTVYLSHMHVLRSY